MAFPFGLEVKKVERAFKIISGQDRILGDITAARIGSGIRAWNNMSKLGGVLISSFADLGGKYMEFCYQGIPALRALAAFPLMMGVELPTLDNFLLMLITHPEILDCHQNHVMGELMLDGNGIETWVVANKGEVSECWLGVCNRLK